MGVLVNHQGKWIIVSGVKILRFGVRTILTFRVVGAEPIDLSTYRSTTIIPDHITVEFLYGKWVSTEVEGFKMKKDGSPGLDRFKDRYAGTWRLDGMPDWARPLMDFDYAERLAGGGDGESSAG